MVKRRNDSEDAHAGGGCSHGSAVMAAGRRRRAGDGSACGGLCRLKPVVLSVLVGESDRRHRGRFRPTGRCRSGDRRSDVPRGAGGEFERGAASPPSQERRQRASELAEGRDSDRGSFDARRAACSWVVAERGAMGLVSPYRAMPAWTPALRAPPTETLDLRAGFALPGDAGLETGVPKGRYLRASAEVRSGGRHSGHASPSGIARRSRGIGSGSSEAR